MKRISFRNLNCKINNTRTRVHDPTLRLRLKQVHQIIRNRQGTRSKGIPLPLGHPLIMSRLLAL
jgi:hypothetical protein